MFESWGWGLYSPFKHNTGCATIGRLCCARSLLRPPQRLDARNLDSRMGIELEGTQRGATQLPWRNHMHEPGSGVVHSPIHRLDQETPTLKSI